jgi:dienelactone hydrolase
MRTAALALLLASLTLTPGCSRKNAPSIEGKEVSYAHGGTVMKGYLVTDAAAEGKRPGILVVHEWWGQNEYARTRARMLAELGYTALAVDMFGEGKQAAHPADAQKFVMEAVRSLDTAKARFLAAYELLARQESVDPGRIGAIGYCFGGGVVLAMAREGVDLKGVVSFHGSLGTPAPAEQGKVRARILVCNGAEDPFVTAEQIDAFKKEMQEAGADVKFVNYSGAKHSFTNPAADEFGKQFDLPLAYSKEADDASWRDMQESFRQVFAR